MFIQHSRILTYFMLVSILLGAAISEAAGDVKSHSVAEWTELSTFEVEDWRSLSRISLKASELKLDLSNYREIVFQKRADVYRLTLLSRFGEPDSYGVRPGLPPSIEIWSERNSDYIEVNVAR